MENKSSDTIVSCINKISLFKSLNIEEKNEVHKQVKQHHFKANSLLYYPGQTANALFIVSRGKVRIYRLAENGKEQLIRILVPGDFTGELALFKEGIYEAFAETIDDTYVCMIQHKDFKNLLLKHPNMASVMLEQLATRLGKSEQQTAWIATETVKDRLTHYLTRVAYIDFSTSNIVVDLNMAKKDLASYLGTTPESLSREWTNLENSGFIKQINKHKLILQGITINANECLI